MKAEAGWAIRAADVTPIVGANITLHYRPKDRRRRDADGLFPVLKCVTDALVDQGVIPEDSWVTVPRAACHIHAPSSEGPAMWVELSEVTEYEEGA
jgi:crossover junction endodeoxyribonuclease RusA